MGYCSLDDLKAAMSDVVKASKDATLQLCIDAATALVDQRTHRRFTTAGTETRVFEACDPCTLEVDDLATTNFTVRTSTAADGTWDVTWAPGDTATYPFNRWRDGITWPVVSLRAVGDYLFPVCPGRVTVEVTGIFGWPAVPVQVRQATIMLAQQQYARYDSPNGVVAFGDMGAMRVSGRFDPDVERLLAPFVLHPVVAL